MKQTSKGMSDGKTRLQEETSVKNAPVRLAPRGRGAKNIEKKPSQMTKSAPRSGAGWASGKGAPRSGWAGWTSGMAELEAARRAGRWADGAPLGRGHGQPYLQAKYARDIRAQVKKVEGRPGQGWATRVKANDWITFKIPGSGGQKLVCRATKVRYFETFEAMLRECSVAACLPGLEGGVEAGVNIYKSFGTFSGATYAELEAAHDAIAIDVVPLH